MKNCQGPYKKESYKDKTFNNVLLLNYYIILHLPKWTTCEDIKTFRIKPEFTWNSWEGKLSSKHLIERHGPAVDIAFDGVMFVLGSK